MSFFIRLAAFTLAASLAFASLADAQCRSCSGGSCAPARVFNPAPVFIPTPVIVPAPVDEEEVIRAEVAARIARIKAKHADRIAREAAQCNAACGCKDCEDGCNCAARSCGSPACRCIVGIAAGPAATATADNLPTGADLSRLGEGCIDARCKFKVTDRHGSYEVSRDRALRMIEAGVPDDATKPWAVVVASGGASEAARKQFGTDPAFASYRAQYRFQAYPEGHWYVADKGFTPGVHLMKADGSGHRHFAALDASNLDLMRGFKQLAPDYDPSKDPDAKPPAPLPGPNPAPAPVPDPALPTVIPAWLKELLVPALLGVVLALLAASFRNDDDKESK